MHIHSNSPMKLSQGKDARGRFVVFATRISLELEATETWEATPKRGESLRVWKR